MDKLQQLETSEPRQIGIGTIIQIINAITALLGALGNIPALLAMLLPILAVLAGVLLLSLTTQLKQLKATVATQLIAAKQNKWEHVYQHHDHHHKHHHYIHHADTPKPWDWEYSKHPAPWQHQWSPHDSGHGWMEDHDHHSHKDHKDHKYHKKAKLKGKKAKLKAHFHDKYKALFHWKDDWDWDRNRRTSGKKKIITLQQKNKIFRNRSENYKPPLTPNYYKASTWNKSPHGKLPWKTALEKRISSKNRQNKY